MIALTPVLTDCSLCRCQGPHPGLSTVSSPHLTTTPRRSTVTHLSQMADNGAGKGQELAQGYSLEAAGPEPSLADYSSLLQCLSEPPRANGGCSMGFLTSPTCPLGS